MVKYEQIYRRVSRRKGFSDEESNRIVESFLERIIKTVGIGRQIKSERTYDGKRIKNVSLSSSDSLISGFIRYEPPYDVLEPSVEVRVNFSSTSEEDKELYFRLHEEVSRD